MTKREAATILNKRKCMVATPVGELELVEDGQGICGLSFGASSENEDVLEEETVLLSEAKRQLLEYFAGERKKFELPLSMHGTKFQMRDWEELLAIPYGETRSYGEIARAIGCPKVDPIPLVGIDKTHTCGSGYLLGRRGRAGKYF